VALITAAEARLMIPALQSTGDDTVLDTLIARAGALMAAYCDYPRRAAGSDATLESVAYTLYSGGLSGAVRVAEDGLSLALPVRPVTAVTSVHDDPDQGYSATYLVTSTDYTTDPVDGVIRLLPTRSHGAFSATPYAIKVVATCGFSTVPVELKHACAMVVRHLWDRRGSGSATSVSMQGQSIQIEAEVIPKEARQILAPYRLMGGVAA
jgi:hypothetical protein